MGSKSREVIYGGQVRAAKMNADRARKFAVEAAREADRAEADAWSCVALVVVRTDRRGVGGFPLFVVDQPITAVDMDMDAMSPSGSYSFEGRRDQYRNDPPKLGACATVVYGPKVGRLVGRLRHFLR
jgi:hypothetical protein